MRTPGVGRGRGRMVPRAAVLCDGPNYDMLGGSVKKNLQGAARAIGRLAGAPSLRRFDPYPPVRPPHLGITAPLVEPEQCRAGRRATP